MDKKILRAIEKLEKVTDAFYADHDVSLEHYNELRGALKCLREKLLTVDKVYDKKKEEVTV